MKMQMGIALIFGALALASAGSTRETVDNRLKEFPKFMVARVGEISKATSDLAEEIAAIFKMVDSEMRIGDRKLEAALAKVTELEAKNADLVNQLKDADEKNKALELELGEMGKMVASLKAELAKANGNIAILHKKIKDLQDENQNLKSTISAKDKENQDLKKKIAGLEQKLKSCIDKVVVPEGYKPIGNHYVKYFAAKKTWQDAAAACKKDGARLLTVEDDETVEWIKSDYPVWTGGNDLAEEGKFVWADFKPISNKYWAENEPDNGIEGILEHDCVLINSPGIFLNNPGKLGDHQCITRWAFACEIPKRT